LGRKLANAYLTVSYTGFGSAYTHGAQKQHGQRTREKKSCFHRESPERGFEKFMLQHFDVHVAVNTFLSILVCRKWPQANRYMRKQLFIQ
jgi:hypothetical protein